jgi:beta-galactosidase
MATDGYPPTLDGLRLGVAYYPEQWPEDRWQMDAALMAEAGISLVRVGEFAWARLQPSEAQLDLEWLDAALDVLAEAGLGIVLGTPTAAPPAWLVERHPEILPVAADGRTAPFGHRRHYCPNQPAFREAAAAVVTALADRYGRDPRVVAWQIDNELGGRCFCETCRRRFQEWLEERHGSLDNLNESWGTAFWSQTYTSWAQIPLPRLDPVPLPEGFAPYAPNPGHALDFRRFTSESLIAFLREQLDILRRRTSGQLVTHNLMGFRFGELDYHALAAELDLVAWDNYPVLDPRGRWSTPGLAADAMRGLAGRPTWVLEQQVGPVGWETLLTPDRAQMRLHAYQTIAHGATAVFFFRWRTARHGTEQHWHGILGADGRPRRRYRELRRLAAELERLGEPLAGAHPVADVALLHDYDSRWALQGQPTNAALAFEDTVQRHYEALRRLGLGVDVLSPTVQLERYRVVVAPCVYVIDPAVAAAFARYVEGGGVLVLGARSGVKDRSNAVPERPLPAWLDELAGLEVADYASLRTTASVPFVGVDPAGMDGSFSGWYEDVELKGARALAVYTAGDFAGGAAVTANAVGRGSVLYLAGAADEPTLRRLYGSVGREAGLPLLELPEGVEVARLDGGSNGELRFVLNHGREERALSLDDGRWHDLVGDRDTEGTLILERFGVALLAASDRVAAAGVERAGRGDADR